MSTQEMLESWGYIKGDDGVYRHPESTYHLKSKEEVDAIFTKFETDGTLKRVK